jgi:tight adherence protein B
MNQAWTNGLTWIAVGLFAAAVCMTIYDSFLRYYFLLNSRIDELSSKYKTDPNDALFKNIKPLDATGTSWAERIAEYVDQSGLRIRPGQLAVIGSSLGVSFAAIAWVVSNRWWIAILAAAAASLSPLFYVRLKRARRMRRLALQLPHAFDSIGRAVRAGQTIPGAFQLVAEELDSPLAEEFLYCYEQQNLGMSYDATIRGLAQRTGILELQILAVALLVQARTGGNLIELLSNLSKMVTQRIKMQQRIKTLTSEGRMQANVLMVLPATAFLALLVLSPSYAGTLLDYPWLLAGTVTAQLVGAVWIRRCVSLEF